MSHYYKRFLDGIPEYLARYYWWAYLSPRAVWFFDHQLIISAILFGQYHKLMSATLARLQKAPLDRVLQLTCVYGCLTPTLIERVCPEALHLTDVADVQLNLARSKMKPEQHLLSTRMNAERLGYRSDGFSTIILFFLLHEMPPEARRNTLREVMRVLSKGGSLILTEYGHLPTRHFLYRFPPTRWVLTRLEPFLGSFWKEDLGALLNELGEEFAKQAESISHKEIFSGFYRVTEYKIRAAN